MVISMKQHKPVRKALSLVMVCALLLSLCVFPASAAEPSAPASQFVNTSDDGGDNMISLTSERTFKAGIPVDMTEAEAKAAAETAVWSLVRDSDQEYVDETLFPNQSQGGTLSSWVCADGETPFFRNIVSGAETVDGQVYLTVTFDNCGYFGDDLSVPHINGGYYLDVCGYFDLSAAVDGKTVGSVALKMCIRDRWWTMWALCSTSWTPWRISPSPKSTCLW